MKLHVAGISDVGILRDHNEDSFLVDTDHNFFMVADGMGGHVAGGRASQLAVEIVGQVIGVGLPAIVGAASATNTAETTTDSSGDTAPGLGALEPSASLRPSGTMIMGSLPEQAAVIPPQEQDPIIKLLTEAIQKASATILNESKSIPQYHNMGTTICSLLIQAGNGYYGHVGDSRLYRCRDGAIEQITQDHSLVNEQVKAGIIDEAQARSSQWKNIITRSVGFDAKVAVDTGVVDIRPGDQFLLCSDGCSNMLSDEELRDIMVRNVPEKAVRFCVNLANSRGGDDNITVIVAAVEE